MRQIIISDLHLGSKLCQAGEILRLLSVPAERFIINGDIVDSANFNRFSEHHWGVLQKIRQLQTVGKMILIQGNHDSRLQDITGIRLSPSFLVKTNLGEHLVTHGDFFDPTLNWPLITDIADWCYHTAQSVHKKSARLAKKAFKHFGGVINLVRQRAVEFAKSRHHRGIICGHTHFADDAWIHGVRYLNTGSWTEIPAHYVEVTDDSVSLKEWK